MRRIIAIALAISMVFAFAGCGCSNKAEEVSYEVSGDILDADGTNITIATDSNEKLTFNYEGVQVDEPDGTSEFSYGQQANISYTGEIKDGDTSGCKVTHVVVTLGDEKYITGKLEAVDDEESTIVIKDEDDNLLAFDVSDAERHYDEGLKVGDDLVVVYMGRIVDQDTSKLYVTCVVDENVYNADPEEEIVTVTAVDETVWTLGHVNIREGSDTTSDVVTEVTKGTKLHRTGVLSNGWSRITYKDKDRYVISDALTTKKPEKDEKKTTEKTTLITSPTEESTTVVTSPTETTTTEITSPTEETTTEITSPTEEPTEPEEEIETSPIEGTVVDFTVTDDEARVVIDCDNGHTYDLDVSDADVHILDGEICGNKIYVEFTGKIVDGDASGIHVTTIYCAE